MKKIIILSFLSIILMSSCATKATQKSGADATIETPFGTMKVKLYDSTPQHKANFLKLAKEGYYNDLLFHRVINKFMIQGGDPQSKGAATGVMLGSGGPGYLIPAEIGKKHFKGALAAARTGGPGNPDKKSSGSQFYIVQGDIISPAQLQMLSAQKGFSYTEEETKKYSTIGGTPFLDGDYTVFGEVIEGLDVIDKIAASQTDSNNRPFKDVTMKIK
ncbi:MAG: peptidylprolyl isomerase [Saprospiraceae bacterium]|jgi:peptidyl-prolyl cis-trans isomerase B (cyclophilin B)|nr:peptidylprolyl isomerase [Saprospiraceae bacterium]MBK7465697.1 peptidylprolyl isomerase [Saprospiraceae bacterium]MBK9993877.1 peptidylprolyl isomerase [Saprospiraceae bacterium]